LIIHSGEGGVPANEFLSMMSPLGELRNKLLVVTNHTNKSTDFILGSRPGCSLNSSDDLIKWVDSLLVQYVTQNLDSRLE